MQSTRVRPTISQCSLGHLFRAGALALATGLGGLTFLTLVTPVQAEQASQRPGSFRTAASQDPGNLQNRLERVEKELEKRKVEREKVRLDRARRVEEEKKKEREWDTKFDLLRRDPISRLELTKDGWMSFKKSDTQVRVGGFFQLNMIHNFQDTDNKFGKFQPGKFPVPECSCPAHSSSTRSILEQKPSVGVSTAHAMHATRSTGLPMPVWTSSRWWTRMK